MVYLDHKFSLLCMKKKLNIALLNLYEQIKLDIHKHCLHFSRTFITEGCGDVATPTIIP
jgi:hypothetical protein